jgi:hypothetical protein
MLLAWNEVNILAERPADTRAGSDDCGVDLAMTRYD